MPVDIQWVNVEKTILQYTLSGNWTWSELFPKYEEAIRMEESVSHMVDIIIDLRSSGAVPSNTLSHMRSIANKQPPNVGISVLVTRAHMVEALFRLAKQVNPKIKQYFEIVTDLDAAYQVIQQLQMNRVLLK